VAAPERAAAHHLLGAALVEVGWRDAAEREFTQAFDLDGRRPDTAYCLAALLAAAQPPRRAEARTWYDRALALGAARDAGLDGFFADGK
jgi:Flp pilus assembly protein TadD